MLGKLSSDGVTIKAVVGGNLKTYESNKMKVRRTKKTCSIDCRADKSVRNYAGVEKCDAGTNSLPEHPSGLQNRVNPSLGSLNSQSLEKKWKRKRNCKFLQILDSHYEKKILKMSTWLLILSIFLLFTTVRLFGSLRILTR